MMSLSIAVRGKIMMRKILLFAGFSFAIFLASQAQISNASGAGNLVITKVVYKGLQDGKHNLIVFWDGLPKDCQPDTCLATKAVIDAEVTDSKGASQKASITLTATTAGNPDVSFTPVPIPKNPIVVVPITELFRAKNIGSQTLKFQITLTVSALTRTVSKQTVTQVVSKEGTIKAVANAEGK
jgi:hypothetical protein